jgi:hypothetical protein
MSMQLQNPRGRWPSASAIVALLLIAGAARLSAQSSLVLSSLTVAPANLPAACRLRPFVPPARPEFQADGSINVDPRSFEFMPFTDNPWLGVDRRLIVEARKRVDRAPALSDAPPPDAASVAAWEARWTEHVVEAYRAIYDAADDMVVEVTAIRFDDARSMSTTSELRDLLNRPRGASVRRAIGPVVIRVTAASRSACFEAVRAHVEGLR